MYSISNISGFKKNLKEYLKYVLAFSTIPLLFACSTTEQIKRNTLDIGFESKIKDVVNITPFGLMSYNGKTKKDLFALRTKLVQSHPELLIGSYAASEDIFGSIDDTGLWWGIRASQFPLAGMPPTEGQARESAIFGNPLMLVIPEWHCLNCNKAARFNTEPEFVNVYPCYVMPTSVKIFPKDKKEEIVYNMMSYFNDVKSITSPGFDFANVAFDLRTYNAKDFGFNYMYIVPGKSINISKFPPDLIPINQGFRVSKACGDKCNDITELSDNEKNFVLKGIPASLEIILWKEKPASYLQTPDMRVVMQFN